MLRTIRPLVVALPALLLLITACDQAEPELTTTTTAPAGEVTTLPGGSDTTAGGETTTTVAGETTTTLAAQPVESYEVIVRTGTDDGEVLWILIPPGDYSAISLENLVVEVVDETDAPVLEMHVFDDADALEAGRIPAEDRTDAEQTLVDDHYLVSLTEGNVVTFRGPFEDQGEFILGS